jgi:hypothetical protein
MKLKVQSSKQPMLRLPSANFLCLALLLSYSALTAWAQTCQTSGDLDDATRSALTAAGQKYFDMAAKGDTASLRQHTVANLAADFSNLEGAVKDNQANLAGAQANVRSVFMLEAEGTAPLARAEFYCGVFGKSGQTATSAAFVLDNLAPGKYGIVILDVASSKGNSSFSTVLQQSGGEWKLWWAYIKPSQVAGHDSDWFASRAREYKAKGQQHNAYLFLTEARLLVSPVPFMSTQATDKLYDDSQGVQPADVPQNGKTVDLAAGGTTYKLTALFPEAVGNDLDLIVKYEVADVSNTNQAYQNNVAAIKALVAKYPEIRDAFAAVVARAVQPDGRDYGTLLAMKDIK